MKANLLRQWRDEMAKVPVVVCAILYVPSCTFHLLRAIFDVTTANP